SPYLFLDPDASLKTGGTAAGYLDLVPTLPNQGSGSDATQGTSANQGHLIKWSGRNYLHCPGVVGNYGVVADAPALRITESLTLAAQVTLPSWTPPSRVCLVAKYDALGDQRSYQLAIDPDGTLVFSASRDGLLEPGMVTSTTV